MLNCKNCGSDVPDTYDKCPTCGAFAGPPNVRAANAAAEIQALDERYQKAFETAKAGDYLPMLEKFDEALRQSSAVINVEPDFLYFFTTNARNLYANYESAVTGQIRKPAPPEFDKDRRTAGGALFGSYANEIQYAALSLDGAGPSSYGSYAMKFRDIAIRARATTLENNSYDFVSKHDLKPRHKPAPPGYLAPWDNRHKLAVAKLVGQFTTRTVETDFPRLLFTVGLIPRSLLRLYTA